MLLADARLPSGGHAHSGGLEAAVSAGRVSDLTGLLAFLRGRLHTAGLVGAAFASATCRAALTAVWQATAPPGAAEAPASPTVSAPAGPAGPATTTDAAGPATTTGPAGPATTTGAAGPAATTGADGLVEELDEQFDARTPSPALRRASRRQGRALLRAGRSMWKLPVHPRQPQGPHQPIALGLLAAAAGIPPAEVAAVAAYQAVAGPASAAVRLLGLDPYQVHRLLAGLTAEIDDVAERAALSAEGPVAGLPAAGAPLLDITAEVHASWEVRLFAS